MAYEVTYTKPVERRITKGEYELINDLNQGPAPNRVAAIKFMRNQYDLTLREAKDICEAVWNNKATYVPD